MKRLWKESSHFWVIKRMLPLIFLLNWSLILCFRMLSSGYNKILISKWLNLFCISLGPQTMQNHAAVFRTGDVLKEGCEKMDSIYKSMDDMKTFDRGQWRLNKLEIEYLYTHMQYCSKLWDSMIHISIQHCFKVTDCIKLLLFLNKGSIHQRIL